MESITRAISGRTFSPKGVAGGFGQGEEVQDVDDVVETPKERARAAGKKVMVFTQGSRGDVQPFVALASALQGAGFVVQVPTNVNHVAFLQKFGLTAVPCSTDVEALLKTPKFIECMSKGDMFKFMEGIGEENKKTFPMVFSKMLAAIDAFMPDVICSSPLSAWEVGPVAKAKKIPFIMGCLQCIIPSKYQQTMFGEPSCFPHKLLGYGLFYIFSSGERDAKNVVITEQCPEAKEKIPQSFQEFMLNYCHPYAPVMYGFSPSLANIRPDWTEECKKRSFFTGFWVVGKEEQERRLQRQDSKFGGNKLPELCAFINAGDIPPVYIGWGSMLAVSPEFMACLAIRSLMQANLRGIVLGGWAELSIDKLEGQRDTDTMKTYCKENVLFMKTAPHEWLFPQCSVTVHHGGSGTTAAALRSGVPTIVTPVAFDQFDNGLLVQNGGCGIRTSQLSKLTPSQLAKALSKCTTNKEMSIKAERMGNTLRNEDGLRSSIKVLDDWIMEEVITGKYAASEEQRLKEIAKVRTKPAGRCYYFGQLCCSCGKTDWSVKL